MKSVSFLFVSLFLLTWSSVGIGEKTCGEAKIVSGTSCSTLKVQFHLESCGGTQQEASIECEVDRANALVMTDSHTYHIPLREIAPGVWTLVGSVREYPKKWKPDSLDHGPVIFRVNRSDEKAQTWPSVFEVNGQFRFRAEENRKNDFSSQRGFSSLRARAGLVFHPNENMEFLLEPQAVQIFGEPLLQTATSNVNVSVGTSGANRDPQMSFHQAFGEIRASRFWRLIMGRQTLVLGDEVLVGASDWENPGRSFDGIRSRVEWEKSSWDIFSTKLWDGNTQGSGKGDRDFHGTYLSWTHPSYNLSLAPYLFWLRDHRDVLNQIFTSGLHLRVNLGELEIRGEASGQWGDTTGQQIWTELRSKSFTSIGVQVGLDGFWSSSNFNSLFPSTHKWLGWADVFGRRNLSGLGFLISLKPVASSEVSLRGLHFLRSNTDFPAYQTDGTTPVSNFDDKSQTLGSELDLILKSRIIPSAEIVTAASVFLPGEVIKGTNSESWVGRLEVSLISNF